MNDIIERLQQHNQDRFNSIELPDEDQLIELEEQILLPLPADLKTYLLHASHVLLGRYSPVTATDPSAHTHLPEVVSQAWEQGLERDLLAFCQHEDGYYFITQHGEVGYWSAALGVDEQQHWDDLWHWAERVWLADISTSESF